MPKFEDRFLSVGSLGNKYDRCPKTVRRYLRNAEKAGLRIERRKMYGRTCYSEKDFDKAIKEMGKQEKLEIS